MGKSMKYCTETERTKIFLIFIISLCLTIYICSALGYVSGMAIQEIVLNAKERFLQTGCKDCQEKEKESHAEKDRTQD